MCICSKYGFDIIISEGIIYYALELCYLMCDVRDARQDHAR